MAAAEAERAGLVSRVVPAAELVDEAVKVATVIAAMPPLAVLANKEMVNAAFETNLTQGVQFERRLFTGLFATQDQKEGMAAFVEKRPEIGRASCRERVCQYVEISVVAGSLKKQKKNNNQNGYQRDQQQKN